MLGAQRRLSRLRPLRRAFGQVQQVPSLLVRCLKLIKLPAAPLSVRFRRAAKPGRKNTSTISHLYPAPDPLSLDLPSAIGANIIWS